jgi:AAA domain, putative AbiEii toxin, Type IV TA system
MCLATALVQPSLPPTVLFDEPELGLHPYALTLLANLFQEAAQQHGTYVSRQVIVSTQSALLLNEFAPEDVIVVERTRGESAFRRLESAQLSGWLEEYTLGELWQKNVLGGRPQNEAMPVPSDGNRDTAKLATRRSRAQGTSIYETSSRRGGGADERVVCE